MHNMNSSNYEWSLDLLNLYHKVKIKVTQRCYSWLNIHVFYQNPQGEVWMIFRFVDSDLWQMNLYHKHKRDTEISVLNEYEFNMNCCYMFFKGSNFYLQITHWYDFIQAWTDVTHFFKVSLEKFPQSEHLYGFINMKTFKFFQECSLTTLNLYHKYKKGNTSKYELTLDLLTVESLTQYQNKSDTKLLFLIEFSCVLSKSIR